jgi:hypothetical protein
MIRALSDRLRIPAEVLIKPSKKMPANLNLEIAHPK